MATVDAAYGKLDFVAIAKGIATFLSGGMPGYISVGVIIIMLMGVFWYFKAQIKKWIYQSSLAEIGRNAAKQKEDEQKASNDLEKAADQTNQIIGQNPDAGKPHRPTPAETIED